MQLHKLHKGILLTAVFILLLEAKFFAADADSVVFQNDSTFTIEGVQKELGTEGEWIKVTKDEIDPDAVNDKSSGLDNELNTDWVWRPYNVQEGWSPYSNGYWEYTNCGWMWVSYYNWGWRTCHYGRWWWSSRWGWVWSPGFIWAPAWVVWMYNDGYCGWYPISPWARWHHGSGYWCNGMRYKVRCWTYVEKKHFVDPIPVITPVVDPSGIKEIVSTGKVDDKTYITKTGVHNNGPEVISVENATGRKIAVDNVTKYNNVKQYNDKTDDEYTNSVKRNDKKENEDVNNNSGKYNNNTNDKNYDDKKNYGEKNEDEKNNVNKNDDSKDYDNNKTNDNGNNNTGKNNNGNNGKKSDKHYTPPKDDSPGQYTPPKKETHKHTKPKYEQPKQDKPRDESGNRDNESNRESRDNGKK